MPRLLNGLGQTNHKRVFTIFELFASIHNGIRGHATRDAGPERTA